MENYNLFSKAIESAVATFKSWDQSQPIKLVSHLDADGISASAIVINLLKLENRKYSITILPQLAKEDILQLKGENFNNYIFADLGSGILDNIQDILTDKNVLILDHHEPVQCELPENITHINPHLFDIDGSKEISGAGVSYLFTEKANPLAKNMAHIAIIGAIGDIQEDNGFMHLKNKILKQAIENETIKVKKGLRMFGMQTKPLHKVLEYSNNPHIPGVSGNESGTIQFLTQLGIDPKKGSGWKKMIHLTDDEMRRLVTGIIMKRLGEINPEDVLGNIYLLPKEKEESPTKDAREFATLLNACGRMNRASCGIGTCLGILKDRRMAMQTLADYKKEIVQARIWYENNPDIIKGKNFIIINAKDQIRHTIIGTLASIISKSNELDKVYIMSLARTDKDTTKVSIRTNIEEEDLDLRDIVKKITTKVGGEAGGHMQAAGALIPAEAEADFINTAKEVFKQLQK